MYMLDMFCEDICILTKPINVHKFMKAISVLLYREAAKAAQKEYERMNEGVASSAYQPTTTSFTYNPEGIPGTTVSESLKYTEPFDEKQF